MDDKHATIARMVKLQLRLDQRQTELIIRALELAVSEQARLGDVEEAGKLATWLTWRRRKLWGATEAGTPAPPAEPLIPTFCTIDSTRYDNRTLKCERGHYMPPVTSVPLET